MERFALLLCAWSAGQPFERDTARSFGVTGVTDTLSTGYLAHCMFDTQLVASSMYALADAHFYCCASAGMGQQQTRLLLRATLRGG